MHSDDALGAGLGAQAAAHAHTGVDHGNAIPDGDGTLGTHADAAAQTQAAIFAAAEVQAAEHGGAAIGNAHIFRLGLGHAAGTGALDIGHLGILVNGFLSQNGGNFSNVLGAVARTGIHTSLALDNGFGHGIAAGIAAGAAVGTPQAFPHLGHPVVGFNVEFLAGRHQGSAQNQTHQADDNRGNNDCIHLFLPPHQDKPAKPMNAMAMRVAHSSTMGAPRKGAGTASWSMCSRIAASSTMEMV